MEHFMHKHNNVLT